MAEDMFRFQRLDIWKKAVDIGNRLLDIADELEKKKLYRFAEQVRREGLSISNISLKEVARIQELISPIS